MEHSFEGFVALAGGINLDIQGISNSEFRSGDSNPGWITSSPGGVCRNIAENLSRLQFPVMLISAFGDDPEGEILKLDCRNKNIDISLSVTAAGRTARYLCLASSDASLVGAVADMAIMETMTPDFFESRKDTLACAAAIVIDTNLSEASIHWFARQFGRIQRAGEKRPLLILDTVSAAKAFKARECLAEFDCVKPNLEEARVLAGVTGSAGISEILESLHSCDSMPAQLYISLGEQGIVCVDSKLREQVLVPLPPRRIRPAAKNRSGAGDAACAGLVYASLHNLSMKEKAEYALTMAVLAAAAEKTVYPELNLSILEREKERFYESVS